MNKRTINSLLLYFFLLTGNNSSATETPAKEMDNQRLHQLLSRIDTELKGQHGYWIINYQNISVTIITDEKANRMRIISPVASINALNEKQLVRILQANFDSTLDARYAIAKNKLWSAYIHPLNELSNEQFYSGLAQTITLVKSYGDTYSSGALVFKGGDSKNLNRETYLDVLRKGLKI